MERISAGDAPETIPRRMVLTACTSQRAEHEADRLGAIAGGDGQQPRQGLRNVPAEGLLDPGGLGTSPGGIR